LLERLRYNLLFRWFVGLGMDDLIWNVSTFSKNRERFLDAAKRFTSRTLTAEEGRKLIAGRCKFRRTKTECNRRTCGRGGLRDTALVFADPIGLPWKPASIATLFRATAKRPGIGNLRFHDLRDSAASL